jgi:ATP-dependent RNA helicase RhlE
MVMGCGRWCSAPPASWRSRWRSRRRIREHLHLWVGVIYGGYLGAEGHPRPACRLRRAGRHPGRLIDHLERERGPLRGRGPGARRGRPDAGHGLPPADQPDPAARAEGPADPLLLRDAPQRGASLAYDSLRDPVTVEAAPQKTTAEGVEQFVYPVEGRRKTELLLKVLERPGMDSVIVFTRTKIGADRVISQLERANVSAASCTATGR